MGGVDSEWSTILTWLIATLVQVLFGPRPHGPQPATARSKRKLAAARRPRLDSTIGCFFSLARCDEAAPR